MKSIKVILQFFGIVNVACIIAFNGAYQFSSPYVPNVIVVLILLVLAALSIAKDVFDYIGVEVPYRPLYEFFRFASVMVPGILSSLVILIPKLLLIESQHLDSMPVRFTVRITRNWNKEELSAYLTNLVEERGISYLVSEADCSSIVESSDSMSELRSSLNTLVTERLENLRSEIADGAAEAKTIIVQQGSSWASENTLLVVGVTILTVAVIAGIGYLIYTNYGDSNAPAADTSPEFDVELEIAKIYTLMDKMAKANEARVANVEALGDSLADNTDETLKKLSNSISRVSENANLGINSLNLLVDDLTKKVDSISASLSDADIEGLRKIVTGFHNDIERVKLIAEQSPLRVTELSGESDTKVEVADVITTTGSKSAIEVMRSALPQRSGLISGGVADPVGRLSKKVENMYKNVNTRITTVEETSLRTLGEAARFAKAMGAAVKIDIMSSDELQFLKALKECRAIREILMDQEVKDTVAEIIKKGED